MVDDELQDGLAAYAQEQTARETETPAQLMKKWARIRERGRAYLAHETVAAGEDVVVALDEGVDGVDDDNDGGDDAEEEGVPDYEDEGDDEVIE